MDDFGLDQLSDAELGQLATHVAAASAEARAKVGAEMTDDQRNEINTIEMDAQEQWLRDRQDVHGMNETAASYGDSENPVIPGGEREARLKARTPARKTYYTDIGHNPDNADNSYLYLVDSKGVMQLIRVSDLQDYIRKNAVPEEKEQDPYLKAMGREENPGYSVPGSDSVFYEDENGELDLTDVTHNDWSPASHGSGKTPWNKVVAYGRIEVKDGKPVIAVGSRGGAADKVGDIRAVIRNAAQAAIDNGEITGVTQRAVGMDFVSNEDNGQPGIFEPGSEYGDRRKRFSQGIANGKMDKVKARQAAEKIFGRKIIAAMVDSGMLTFADSLKEADPFLTAFDIAGMEGVQGWADSDGKAFILAKTIESETELKAIILHEIGQHLGFGDDIQAVSDFFDDMVEAAQKGNPIAKRAVLQATWAMLQDGRYSDAVALLGDRYTRFVGMDFKEFLNEMSDEDLDTLLDAVFLPAGTGIEIDEYDRRAFANTLMEEVGAYVHNARAAATDAEKAQSLWAKFLGFIRRTLYRLSNGRLKMGSFTDADIEAMAMSAIKKQAERGASNQRQETRRRFSVNEARAKEAKANTDVDRAVIKPDEFIDQAALDALAKPNKSGAVKYYTPGVERRIRIMYEDLRAILEGPGAFEKYGKMLAKPTESGFYVLDAEAASQISSDPNSPASESNITGVSKLDGKDVIIQKGMQYAGLKGAMGSGDAVIDGVDPGFGEEAGFGLAHMIKHVLAVTARYAASKSIVNGKLDEVAFKDRLNQLRNNPDFGLVEAMNDLIEKSKQENGSVSVFEYNNKISLYDNDTGMQLVLNKVGDKYAVRTFMVMGASTEGDDKAVGNVAVKIANGDLTPAVDGQGKPVEQTTYKEKFSKQAEAWGQKPDNLVKGDSSRKAGRRFSVSSEVGGSLESPASNYPPVIPPTTPAPPGAAPVNPELSGAQRAWDIVTGRYFSGISVKAHQNARRFPGASIQAVADIIHNRPGSQGSAAPRSIPTAIMTARARYTNRFRDIMEPMREHLSRMDTATREAFYEKLTDMITGRRNMDTGFVGQMAENLKKLLADLHTYRTDAGEELGEIQDYFPVVYNSDMISKDRNGFLADATRAYKIELGKTLSGPELDATAAASALALYNTHVRGMGAQEFGSLFEKATPGGRENSARERAFGRQAQNIMRRWQSNDPFLVITRYIGGATKSAELARRFGADGSGWTRYAEGMEAEGVPHEVIDEMHQLVCQAAGVATPGIGKSGQTFMDAVAMYTAATSLGKSFMSNLFEPVSMGVRTGSPLYMIRAFVETWTRSLNEFAKDGKILGALHQDSFWQEYGEHIGTIHNNLEDAWMTTHSMELGMDNQNPRMRWLTNRIYKANLMDATETAKQQASHALGHSYINDLCNMISGDHWMNKFGMDASRSATQDLIELGVPEADHQQFISWMKNLQAINPRQRMALMTDGSPMSKLYEEAQVRFTNQTAVRSNRAHRPVFQDNLMGKMFLQLQSFSYSYAAEANSRIYDNLKRSASSGDYTAADRMRLIAPALMLPFAILAFGAMFKLRRELYPTEASIKHDDDPWWAKLMDAASYAGVFGPKVEQAMKFVMRDQPPGGVVGQHTINAARAAKGYATAAIGPDEKYDKAMAAANKAAVKAAIPPVKGAIVAGASAINPTLGTAASMFVNDTTLSNAAIEATQPEKPDKKREPKNPYTYRQPPAKPAK